MTVRVPHKGRVLSINFCICIFTVLSLIETFTCVSQAQLAPPHITIDGSLESTGGSGAQPFTDTNVEIIQQMGVTRGGNLFHSFGQFNIPTDHSVTFSGDPGIANILSRVTGGNTSNINGTLVSNIQNANLFLLNPAGVIFGPNAKLDVKGAFYASTADFLQLGQDDIFYSTLERNSVLTSAAPEAFGFLGANSSSIASTSLAAISVESLDVQNGHVVSLVSRDTIAGEEPVDGIAISGGTLKNADGLIQLVSIGSSQLPTVDRVSVNIETLEVQGLSSSGTVTQETVQLGSTRFSEGAQIDVSGKEGGTVVIRGGRLTITEGAEILSNTRGTGVHTNEASMAAIDIETESIVIQNGGGLSTGTFSSSSGGDIRLMATNSLEITEGSFVFTFTESDGNAGDIVLNAPAIDLLNQSEIISETDSFEPFVSSHIGNTGNILLTANNLELAGNSSILTQTFTSGHARNIQITVNRTELVDNSLVSTKTFSAGNTGNIELNMEQGVLAIRGGSSITTQLFGGTGSVGNIDIKVPGGNVLIEQFASIFTAIDGNGTGGSIHLRANNLDLNNVASIGVQNFGPEDAGSVTITLTGNLKMHNASLIDIISRSPADAADLNITAKDIVITNDSHVTTTPVSEGRGGNLNIQAENLQVTDNGRISSSPTGSGDAGSINIDLTKNLLLTNGASISTRSIATGNAGNINVKADESIFIDNGAVTTNSENSLGGNIKLTAENLIQISDSQIRSNVQEGSANAGSINIDPDFIVIQNSQINTSANVGNGGDVTLVANAAILIDPLSQQMLDTSSQFGGGGTVNIRAPIQNLSESIAPLPEALVKISALFAARCAAQKDGKFSSFLQGGREGTPPGATGFLSSPLTFSPSGSEGTTSVVSQLGFEDVPKEKETEWKIFIRPHAIDLAQGCSAVPASRS